MDKEDIIEELLTKIEGAANMMRGMMLDPAIHIPAKKALDLKIKELDALVEKYI